MAEDFRWIIPGTTKWSRTYAGRGGRRRTHSAAAPQDRRRDQDEGDLRIIADGDLVAVEARGENVTKSGDALLQHILLRVPALKDGKLKEVTEIRTPSLRRGCWATRGVMQRSRPVILRATHRSAQTSLPFAPDSSRRRCRRVGKTNANMTASIPRRLATLQDSATAPAAPAPRTSPGQPPTMRASPLL